MRLAYVPLLAVCMAASLCAADAPIRLPVAPVVPSPMPGPPAAVTKLGKGARYVIAAKVECDLLVYPAGLVEVIRKTGPRDWTAVFSGGTGEEEDKHFPEPFLYGLKAVGTGQATVTVIPRGYKDPKEWVTVQIDVDGGQGPIPPPKPKPDPGPKPTPVAASWAIVVEETATRTPEIARVLNDITYWNGLKARGISWRFYDKDSTDAKAKKYDQFAAQVGLPAILFLDATGKVIGKEKLPTTTAGIDALLVGGK